MQAPAGNNSVYKYSVASIFSQADISQWTHFAGSRQSMDINGSADALYLGTRLLMIPWHCALCSSLYGSCLPSWQTCLIGHMDGDGRPFPRGAALSH